MKKYTDTNDIALEQEIYDFFYSLNTPFDDTTQNTMPVFPNFRMPSWAELENLASELEVQETKSK